MRKIFMYFSAFSAFFLFSGCFTGPAVKNSLITVTSQYEKTNRLVREGIAAALPEEWLFFPSDRPGVFALISSPDRQFYGTIEACMYEIESGNLNKAELAEKYKLNGALVQSYTEILLQCGTLERDVLLYTVDPGPDYRQDRRCFQL